MSQMPMAAIAADQRFYGVVIGIVTNVNDEQGLGRVEIALPWYAKGYRRWARIAQFYAGPDYGSTWVPEKDGEVLVAFSHGDMRWPYVLGCLHGKVDKPPHSRSSSKDVRTLRTPSGSELSFDESLETVTLKTSAGASVTLAEKSGEITLKGKSKITLSAPEVVIEGTGDNGKVTVKGAKIALN